MIRNLIWDFDGSLFDTYRAQAELLSKILRDYHGVEIEPKSIRKLTSVNLGYALDELAKLAGTDAITLRSLLVDLSIRIPLKEEPPFPFAKEICLKVRESGGQNFINTHKDRKRLTELLKYHGMDHFFSHMITVEDSFPRKPDPASFIALVDRHHLNPGETMVIGDRDLDITGGRNAGLKTYFFDSNGIGSRGILSDYREESLEPLLKLI